MEFGKLPNVDSVDFSLPPEHPENATLLHQLPPAGQPRIYLGATGYNMKAWVGRWYPAGTRDKDMPAAYGRQFNTIEHNSTHYRIPDAATVARRREEMPADFRFCPKIPQVISHSRNLGATNGLLDEFCEAIRGLEDRLGSCFIQLPPQMDVSQIPVLERFLDRWPEDLSLAVEVRHPSFFEPTVAAETYFQVLSERRVAAVITDVADRRDVCHMRLTAPVSMVRFVGNGLHPSDYERIREWAARLKRWTDGGLRDVYFFTHEPDNLLAPDLAMFAAGVFSADIPGARLRGPSEVPSPPLQGSLFE
jgi:uncharacterized protein YecE (DUF72 family)